MRLGLFLLALAAAVWLGLRPEPYLTGFGLILGLLTLLWLLSLALEDASIIDSFWGPGFVILTGYALWAGEGATGTRDFLLFGLVAIWGVRLGLHIFLRNHGHGEDYRYRQWRKENGASWWWKSYLKVFVLQGLLMWVIAAPLLASRFGATHGGPMLLDLVGTGVWLVGFGFESIGDWQLRRFKADPSNQGKVMDRGLWSLTRHPNYFGDALLWWGYFLFAVAAGAWWTVFAPIIMTGLLMKVSGVTLLESELKKKPGYEDYVRNTPAFFPRLLPRRS